MARVRRAVGGKRQVKRVRKITANKKNQPDAAVKLELVVTRASGDQERTKLGQAKNLLWAYEWRKRLTKVAAPRRVA